MSGSNIGVVRYRLNEASAVAKNGGILYQSESGDTLKGVRELIEKLKDGELEGIVLDKYTYLYIYRTFKSNHTVDVGDIETFFLHETVQREMEERNEGFTMSYGLLVTQRDHYNFIKRFVRDSRMHLETCKSLGINEITKREKVDHDHGIFSPNPRGLFWPSLICTGR